MKKAFGLLTFAGVMVLSAPAVYGQNQGEGGRAGPFMACRQDAKTFCQGIQPGGGRILDCLKDHYKEISDGCYNALQNMPSHGSSQNGGSSNEGPSPSDDEK